MEELYKATKETKPIFAALNLDLDALYTAQETGGAGWWDDRGWILGHHGGAGANFLMDRQSIKMCRSVPLIVRLAIRPACLTPLTLSWMGRQCKVCAFVKFRARHSL